MSDEQIDDGLHVRIVRYAVFYLRDTLRKLQTEAVELDEQLKLFPNSAISEFDDAMPLKEESDGARRMYAHCLERITDLSADYELLAARLAEFDKDRRSAMFKDIFGGSGEQA